MEVDGLVKGTLGGGCGTVDNGFGFPPVRLRSEQTLLGNDSRQDMREFQADNQQQNPADKDQYRDVLDLLRNRVELLAGKDKVLMTMYLENGTSFRQLAQLAGVSEATIARRIRRLTARLTEGEYIACLRNHGIFNEAELNIARDHFLRGMSIRKIAASRHCTFYNVRKTLGRIKSVLSADSGQGSGNRR